jgi:hypothetical protein
MIPKAIPRTVYDWGIELTTMPFEGDAALGALAVRAEIDLPRGDRRSAVRITFAGSTTSTPLTLVQAQTWVSALNAIIAESRTVMAEMVKRKH